MTANSMDIRAGDVIGMRVHGLLYSLRVLSVSSGHPAIVETILEAVDIDDMLFEDTVRIGG